MHPGHAQVLHVPVVIAERAVTVFDWSPPYIGHSLPACGIANCRPKSVRAYDAVTILRVSRLILLPQLLLLRTFENAVVSPVRRGPRAYHLFACLRFGGRFAEPAKFRPC